MSYGNFKGKSKMTPINSNALEDIITNYPEVNVEWLLTGKGNMLKTSKENEVDTSIMEDVFNYKDLYEEAKYTIELQKKYIENLEQQLKKNNKNL